MAKEKQGFIKLNRGFFDNFLWNEARTYSKAEAWLDLIQMARFEASTERIGGKVIELQRGEIPASRRFLELRWTWGSTKVSNFLKMLTDFKMIKQSVKSGQTTILLLNFGTYNDTRTTDKPPTNQRQTTDKPEANQNKELQEGKELNNFLLEKETKEENLSKENPTEIFPQSESVEPGAEERKKVAQKKERFKPPTVQEVQEYCNERQNGIQAYTFVNFYQSKGWKVGNQPMKDWRAAVITWEQKNKQNGITNTTNAGFSNNGAVSNGKVSGRSIVADRISQHLARNSESGNHTIDIEANIVR